MFGAVTQGNPEGTFQSSEGGGPFCSFPAGLRGEAGSPVPTRPPVPERHRLIRYLLGLFPTPCNSKKLSGFSLVPSLPLQNSQVNRFAHLTTKGSTGSEGRSSMWGGWLFWGHRPGPGCVPASGPQVAGAPGPESGCYLSRATLGPVQKPHVILGTPDARDSAVYHVGTWSLPSASSSARARVDVRSGGRTGPVL